MQRPRTEAERALPEWERNRMDERGVTMVESSTHTHPLPVPPEVETQAYWMEQHAKHLRQAASNPLGIAHEPACPYCNGAWNAR